MRHLHLSIAGLMALVALAAISVTAPRGTTARIAMAALARIMTTVLIPIPDKPLIHSALTLSLLTIY
jgi:hypothetical protein